MESPLPAWGGAQRWRRERGVMGRVRCSPARKFSHQLQAPPAATKHQIPRRPPTRAANEHVPPVLGVQVEQRAAVQHGAVQLEGACGRRRAVQGCGCMQAGAWHCADGTEEKCVTSWHR